MKIRNLLHVILLSILSIAVSAQCSITNFVMEAECGINNIVNIEYSFDVDNPGADNLFELYRNGSYVGNFFYGQSTYSYGFTGSDCEEIYTFEIVDQNDADCTASFTFDEPFCCWPQDCNLVVEMEADVECNSEGDFYVTLYVTNPTGSSGGFETIINGVSQGFIDYGLPSYEFGPLDGDCSTIYEIDIIDFGNEECIYSLTAGPQCCPSCDDMIVDYVGDNACTGSGTFFADILITNPGSSNFEVFIDGDSEGIFNYGDQIYTFGPFSGDCQTTYVFEVIDLDLGCVYTIDLEPVCCPEYCSISDLTVEAIECTDINQFSIELNFEYAEVDELVFDFWANGAYHGTYAYSDLPLIIEDYPQEPNNNPYITVFGTGQDLLCANDLAFDGLDCSSTDCTINEVYAEAYECNDQGQLFVDIEFNYTNPGLSNQFTINGNGTNYGTFEYGQTFYTVGPFTPDCDLEYEFIVTDVDNNDCSGFYEYPDALCCDTDECSITGVEAEAICTDDELFLDVWFEYDNPGSSNQFIINVNGQELGPFEYGESFYNIGPMWYPCEPFQPIEVIDVDNEDCNGFFELELPQGLCCDFFDCEITTLDFGNSPACQDGLIVTDWLIDGNNLSEVGFDIYVNDIFETYVEYENDNWYDFDIEDPGTEFFTLKVCDNDNDDCCIEWELENPCYESDTEECSISNIEAEAICTDDELFLDIWFEYDNPGSSNQFIISVWGQEYGPFEYGESFYNVGPVELPCEPFQLIYVTDLDYEDCSDVLDFELPQGLCCDFFDCEITTLDFGDSPVCQDGLIVTDWLIDGNNLSEVGFDIFINNIFETFVQWNSTSWYDFDIEDPGTEFLTIKVCDNDNDDCCIEWDLENPCYESNSDDCSINNLGGEAYDCNDDGEIFFDIFFDVDNPGADNQFTVVGNGNNYGTFEYGQDYYTVGPFIADCETEVELIVTDVNNNNCSAYIGFDEIFCCDTDQECDIVELTVETTPCDDGTNIEINFEVTGGSGQTYITVNDDSFGPYDDLISPLTYIGFLYETEYITVTMCDYVYPDCCATVEVLNPCYEANEDCEITTLDFGPNPICDDGNIVTEWLIDGNNLSESGYDIFVNNEFETFVEWNETSWYDFDIQNPETETFTIKVCDNDNEDCCIEWDLDNPCYDPDVVECTITEIDIDAFCDGTSTYFELNFDYDNTDAATFEVIVNDDYTETFSYDELPVWVYGLDYDSDFITVVITDNENEDCNAAIEFDNPCYEDGDPECNIFDLDVEVLDCDPNGNIYFEISFYTNNPGDDYQFTVNGNGNDYGTFEYGETSYTVGPFDANCETTAELVITDINNNDCQAVWESDEIFCCDDEPEECNIYDVFVEPLECIDDNQVYFHITFGYDNVGDENQFTVVGNGTNYGTFEYGLDFYEVGPVLADCVTELEFIVTDVNNEDCSAFTGHDPACCEDEEECALFELSAEATECLDDNTFNVTIDVEVVGNTNDFFDLNIAGDFIGFYEFEALPLTIEELTYDSQWILVELCENDNPDCCLLYEVMNPCYDGNNGEDSECYIDDIEIDNTNCIGGEVSFTIDFNYGEGNSEEFTINGNGEDYGTFAYDDLPITLDGFEGDGMTQYEFIITDGEDESCNGEVVSPSIDCTPEEMVDFEESQTSLLGLVNDMDLRTINDIKSMEIYDIQGNKISSGVDFSKIIQLDRSVLAGILILRIETSTEVIVKKIVRVN